MPHPITPCNHNNPMHSIIIPFLGPFCTAPPEQSVRLAVIGCLTVYHCSIEGMKLQLMGLAGANKTLEGRLNKVERQLAAVIAGAPAAR